MIQKLYDAGYFSSLDYHMAMTAGRVAGEADPLVLLAMATASRFTSQGHVCVDLLKLSKTPIEPDSGDGVEGAVWPDAEKWISALRKSVLVSDDEPHAPLVLDTSGRLYLARYWQYQQRLVSQLRERSVLLAEGLDERLLKRGLNHLFPEEPNRADAQRLATETSVRRCLTVVSGGPGTGKTHTVVKMLLLIIDQALAAGKKNLRIELSAPTGKAAARLKESILAAGEKVARLQDMENTLLSLIPEETTTIHRLLGKRASTSGFRYHAGNPLPVDVLVVDEASMVDISLMTRLLEATPLLARVILLGDEDQLASVEAGAILGDICHGKTGGKKAVDNGLGGKEPSSPIQECIVRLTRSYRFDEKSGIGNLARAIRNGDADYALALLRDPDVAAVAQVMVDSGTDERSALTKLLGFYVDRYYVPLIAAKDIEGRLSLLDRFRILCAHRKGVTGVEQVNRAVEERLQFKAEQDPLWYAGRPVMILQNDYQLGLYNGDVGVVGPSDRDGGKWMVYFPSVEQGIQRISPARLPEHETVFAMTVHKSQGSEFDHVLVMLPARRSSVVTRELLYTAVTRAKKSVTVLGSEAIIREAVCTPVWRASGLSEQLWERDELSAEC